MDWFQNQGNLFIFPIHLKEVRFGRRTLLWVLELCIHF